MPISVEKNVSNQRIAELGITDWPVWSKEPSKFPWTYDETETCYIVEGEVTVTPTGGDPVTLHAGDIAVFPAGMSCIWEVRKPLRKHYNFS